MVLFTILRKREDIELIVAHFDHGMRDDSQQDRKFVQRYAMSHNTIFEYAEGHLGSSANEQTARKARYIFLRHICKKYNANGIIFAHHQDDLLETALINLLRGTGRHGLNALRSHKKIIRPMLGVTKAEIIAYAQAQHIAWHEDPTNRTQLYLRNYVRHTILATITIEQRDTLLKIIVRQSIFNEKIDTAIAAWLSSHAQQTNKAITLPRYQLIMVPPVVALEILQSVIKQLTGNTIVRPLADKALLFIKTAQPHKRFLLGDEWQMRLKRQEVIVEGR